MKKICIVGHFGHGQNLLNGQTVKTKIITNGLVKQLGEDQVMTVDTHGGAKALFRCFREVGKAFKSSENIMMFPAHNGVKIFAPMLLFYKRLYHRKIHYNVIGGWLPKLLDDNKVLAKQLKKFDCIYVETTGMKKALETKGFTNVVIMPNCKELDILKEEELIYPNGEPYKLCTFSRVMKEKGIEDAVDAVSAVNQKLGRTVYTLDIYGQVDSEQVEWFEELKKRFPDYVSYKGCVPFDKSTKVLKEYYALLFPTRFYTEGIPGTIIDAYAAGVPVVCSRWENYADIIKENITGFSFEINNTDEMVQLLLNLDYSRLTELKSNCIKMAMKYSCDEVIKNNLMGYL